MKERKRPAPLEPRKIKIEELNEILERGRGAPLSTEDYEKLHGVVETLAFVTRELEAKGASIQRLRHLIFGAPTEKTRRVLHEDAPPAVAEEADQAEAPPSIPPREQKHGRRRGHGRNGVSSYRRAPRVGVALDGLKCGERCPHCERGRLYPKPPSELVRIEGVAPLSATVYELDRLRCSGCGDVFTAPAPPGVGEGKYDETAGAMIGLLKYGCGLPFNRIENLQRQMGIPLPAATQWDEVSKAAERMRPSYEELIRQAAQGKILHNDDTTMKILELGPTRAPIDGGESTERAGIFTSGIVSTGDAAPRIALFFTGRQHAGENLADVLAQRAAELDAPIQMCDALPQNTSGELDTIVANCLAHARRKFVEVAPSFPEECRYVLLELANVYRTDAVAKKGGLSPEERLRLHQRESGPVMGRLKKWLKGELKDRRIEPNSTLGDAIRYMQKHWKKLVRFLTHPGAPVDNNIVERALKKVILHRKNSYFYRTQNGARVGDLFMSLIHTCELCENDAFDYLVAIQRHHELVEKTPAKWMPWNYREALAATDPGPPGTP